MSKYELVRNKRDEMRNKRFDRINRRTFPQNRYQMDLQDMVQPDIIIDVEENEPLMIAHLPITDEMIVEDITSSDDIQIEAPVILTEVSIQPTVSNSNEFSVGNSVVHTPEMLAQADDIRKLILLQETIKRFIKTKI